MNGVPVPIGKVANNPEEVNDIATKIKGAVVLKAQVLVNSRADIGGIRFAKDAEEARNISEDLFGAHFDEKINRKVLVEEVVPIQKEFYLGFLIEKVSRQNVLLFSRNAHIHPETIYDVRDDSVLKVPISPMAGITDEILKYVLASAGLLQQEAGELKNIIHKLYKVFIDFDAELVEFSPLVVKKSGGFAVLDARLVVDEYAILRQERLMAIVEDVDETDGFLEKKAKKLDLSYIHLDGNIGVISNGAGLAMYTMDKIVKEGGRPANFMSLGRGFCVDSLRKGLEILQSDSDISGILINIFCCGVAGADVAKTIIQANQEKNNTLPIIVRFGGDDLKGVEHLFSSTGVIYTDSMKDGIQKIVGIVEKVADGDT